MSNCLDNIVSVKGCDGVKGDSLSGLDIFDAPEISLNNLANIANEEYISGLALAQDKIRLACKMVKNDLQSVMAAANVLPNLTDITYTAATFKPNKTVGLSSVQRGLVLNRNAKIQGAMTKQVIHNVYIYPFISKSDVSVYVYDQWAGGTLTTYSIDLTANQTNTLNIEYTVLGNYARVYIQDADVSFASSYLTCFTGCDGRMPNACGYVKGWYDDHTINTREGYGINIDFSCACDYDELLCGLSKGTLGNIVWMRARYELMESLIKTNRLNNWTIYNRDEAKEFTKELYNQYVIDWNTFAQSLPNVLKNMRDSCLDCRGITWKTNI